MADGARQQLSLEQAWAELRLYLQRSRGLCIILLYADDDRAILKLRERTEDAFALESRHLLRFKPLQPATAAEEVMQALTHEVERRSQVRSLVWVDLNTTDHLSQLGKSLGNAWEDAWKPSDPWDVARASILTRLNEWRTWLQQTFRRPLILVLPSNWLHRVPGEAPDLWHVRATSLLLASDAAPAKAASSGAPLIEEVRSVGAIEAALHAAQKDVLIAKERIHPGSTPPIDVMRDLSVSLNKVGDAEREAGRGEAGLAAYRESLELSRQLRQALGDSPQVLRDLSVSLDNVGDAEREAGRGEAGLAAYRESLELRRQLRQALGDSPQVLEDLAIALWRIANTHASPAAAEPEWAEIVSLYGRLSQQSSGVQRYGQWLDRARQMLAAARAH